MPEIFVTTREGERRSIPFTSGTTLMQAITEGDVPELLALCGGVCSCATCHVYVDSAHGGQLAEISEDEDSLLAESSHRGASSRLSCQILLTDALDGMKVTIAPED